MKQKVFFLLFNMMSVMLLAQYTAIPDSAFEAFLEDNGMGDGTPNNGQVLTANIENVTHLDLPSFAGISDMTGIEDFMAVEFLDFSYNTVSNIDLSQNLNLKVFGCAFNQMTSLELSNNTNLEWLVCQANSISNIQLNSPVLHTLECYENQLTSLDLSQCPSLETIDCHINHINNLHISECVELTNLTAWSNNLTFLNVSQNIYLSYIHISYNSITHIDLTNNINLLNFSCTYGNFEALDFSNNPNLTSIGCSYNPQLNYLDMRNGNNENISVFWANDTNLDCIFVDDTNASYLENWHIDETTTFVNNEQECEELNISSIEGNNAIRIYPNPATEYIVISLENNSTFELFETNGKIISKGDLDKGINSIDISHISNGVYIIKLKLDKQLIIKNFIKY